MKFFKKSTNRIIAVLLSCAVFIAALFMPSASVYAAYTPPNESLSYSMYSKSGDYTGSYTLSELDTPSSDLSTASVIGDDDRYTDYSKSGVVKIITSGGFASGFVVSEHVIATAAHLFSSFKNNSDDDLNNVVSSILFFNSNGDNTLTLGKSDVVSIHLPANFFVEAVHSDYDYALITVKEDLSDYICFNLGTMLESYVGGEVYVSGFPHDVNDKDVNDMDSKHEEYTGKGTVSQIDAYTFNYDVDMSSGDSGGPIYTVTSFRGTEYYTVVGINTYEAGTYNFGTTITPSLLHFYLNNPYITV